MPITSPYKFRKAHSDLAALEAIQPLDWNPIKDRIHEVLASPCRETASDILVFAISKWFEQFPERPKGELFRMKKRWRKHCPEYFRQYGSLTEV